MPRRVYVALCLLVGFVMSVAVAWVGAVTSETPGTAPSAAFTGRRGVRGPAPRGIEGMLPSGMTVVAVSPSSTFAAGSLVEREQWQIAYVRHDAPAPERDPQFIGDSMVSFGEGAPAWVDVYASGWPLRALEWTHVPLLDMEMRPGSGDPSAAEAWELGIDYRGTRGMIGDCDGWRRLPVRPWRMGLGLVVNTLVWGAAAATAFSIPGIVVRTRRRARGACVKCGYPLRDAGGRVVDRCPECGTISKPAAMPDTGSPA